MTPPTRTYVFLYVRLALAEVCFVCSVSPGFSVPLAVVQAPPLMR